ncbi:MAG: phosphatidate cytidylyltransferase [Lachnospiraceae bacterium]|nr:phosphatidate cytidylyltransferase [Lachnospiraceae bacterium]
MFKTRLFSGIVVAAAMLVFAWLGGAPLLALLLAVSLIGQYEFYHAVGLLEDGKKADLLTGIGYAFSAVYYVLLYFSRTDLFYLVFVCVLFLLVLLAAYVFTFPKHNAKSVICTFYGFFYVSVMLSFIYLTRSLEDGIFIVWLIFFSSWFCDVFAYFTGILLGRHKLAPVLSPKKSIEGAIGGVVFPAIAGAIYGGLVSSKLQLGFPPVAGFAILCAIGAIVSQIGDLSASAIKRNFEIKDYGTLIPGHGGILDRFDSVIFTAPMIFFVAMFLK